MQEEGKPKSQTEKCEVSMLWAAKSSGGLPKGCFFMAIFTNRLAKNGELVSEFGWIVAGIV